MTRIPEPVPDELSPEARAVLDRIATTRGAIRGPCGVLMHRPALADRVGARGERLRSCAILSAAFAIERLPGASAPSFEDDPDATETGRSGAR